MVKPKRGIFKIFAAYRGRRFAWILPILALLPFISSWASVYPWDIVEQRYARRIFPIISRWVGEFADAAPFSWLDVVIPAAAILLVFLVRRRRWSWVTNGVAALYLIFFW